MLKKTNLSQLFMVTALCCTALYVYFFLILPQSWNFNNEYGQVASWSHKDYDAFKYGWELFKGQLGAGRFLFLSAFYEPYKFKILPNTPTAFHGFLFFLAALTVWAVDLIGRSLKFQPLQRSFAALLVISNFAMKDELVISSAYEIFATPLICFAIYAYLIKRKWLSVLLFTLTLLFKESYVSFAGLYVVFIYFEYNGKKKTPIKEFLPAFAALAIGVGFVAYVLTLPRLYTGQNHLTDLSLKNMVIALIVPALKSSALLLFFAALLCFYEKGKKINPLAVALGVFMVVPMTLFQVIWGPFDSWYYLHMAIPIGWALLGAGLFSMDKQNKMISLVALGACFFSIVSVANGSKNKWDYLNDGKVMANLVCEDFKKNPNVKVYSNCDEPSSHLKLYLQLYNSTCSNPPEFKYIKDQSGIERSANYILVLNKKWCGPFDTTGLALSPEIPVSSWLFIRSQNAL